MAKNGDSAAKNGESNWRNSLEGRLLLHLKQTNQVLETLPKGLMGPREAKTGLEAEETPGVRGKLTHRFSKYNPRESKELGRGGLGRVLEGKHGDGSKQVPCAVKLLFENEPEEDRDHTLLRTTFQKAVALQKLLAGPAEIMPLLDVSTSEDGEPGPDKSGKYWVVMPRADRSLRELLDERLKGKKQPSLDDDDFSVSEIVADMGAMLGVMKEKGVVHLDVKPENLMWVDGEETWKLIDFDGAQRAGTQVLSKDGESWYASGEPFYLTCTSCYVAPELCKLMLTRNNMKICLAPSMDMWACGLIALELFFNMTILGAFYDKWLEETGSNVKFFRHIADEHTSIIDRDVWEFVEEHASPVFASHVKPMLSKEPELRQTVAGMRSHAFLK